MTAFEVLQQRITHTSPVSAITTALAPELTLSRSMSSRPSSVGVFNPITGLMSNVGNDYGNDYGNGNDNAAAAAAAAAALTTTNIEFELPVQVVTQVVKNVQSQPQKVLSAPLPMPIPLPQSLPLPLRVLKSPKLTTSASACASASATITNTKTVKRRCSPQSRTKLAAPKRKDPTCISSTLPLALETARGGVGGDSKVVDKRRWVSEWYEWAILSYNS